jgi:hypothetical protein
MSMVEGWIKKYGVPTFPKTEQYRERRRQTSIANWGFDHHMKNKEVSNRVGVTATQRYGGIGLASPIIKAKANETVKERYDGVDNVFQHESIKQKSRQTCIEKYGAPIYSQSVEYKQLVKEENERKKPIIQKIKDTVQKESLPRCWQNRSYNNLILLLDSLT